MADHDGPFVLHVIEIVLVVALAVQGEARRLAEGGVAAGELERVDLLPGLAAARGHVLGDHLVDRRRRERPGGRGERRRGGEADEPAPHGRRRAGPLDQGHRRHVTSIAGARLAGALFPGRARTCKRFVALRPPHPRAGAKSVDKSCKWCGY